MKKASSIRAVTFDVGGTLIEPWPSVGHVYAAVAARHGVNVPLEVLNEQFSAAWRTKKDFGHSRSDWSELVDATFAGLLEIPPSRSFFAELYNEFSLVSAWRVYDDVLPTLEQLRKRGLKLGIVSNWDERLRPLLHALKLAEWFDAIAISAEVGKAKPSAVIFQSVVARLQIEPELILHVGDSGKEDLQGARLAGLQSRLVKRGALAVRGECLPALSEVVFEL